MQVLYLIAWKIVTYLFASYNSFFFFWNFLFIIDSIKLIEMNNYKLDKLSITKNKFQFAITENQRN